MGSVQLDNALRTSLFSKSPRGIHPALLDACLQIGSSAAGVGDTSAEESRGMREDERNMSSFMFWSARKCEFFPSPSQSNPSSTLWVEARLISQKKDIATFSIDIFDEKNGNLIMKLDDCKAKQAQQSKDDVTSTTLTTSTSSTRSPWKNAVPNTPVAFALEWSEASSESLKLDSEYSAETVNLYVGKSSVAEKDILSSSLSQVNVLNPAWTSIDMDRSLQTLILGGRDSQRRVCVVVHCGNPLTRSHANEVILWRERAPFFVKLLQSLLRIGASKIDGILFLTCNIWNLSQGDSIDNFDITRSVTDSFLIGLLNTVRLEHPEHRLQLIDIDNLSCTEAAVTLFTSALMSPSSPGEKINSLPQYLRLIHDRLFFGSLSPLDLPTTLTASSLQIQPAGVYLICGGLGAIGLTTCRWLLDQGACHVVIITRTPESLSLEITQEILLRRRGDDECSSVGTKMSDDGVHIFQGDICNLERLSEIVSAVEDYIGQIKGIVHLAGVLSDGIFQHQDKANVHHVLQPKVQGALNIHAVLQQKPDRNSSLDFLYLASSLAAYGSPGQSLYSAANSFLDAFAIVRHSMGLPCTSIQWDGWDRGMLSNMSKVGRKEVSNRDTLNAEEGMRMMEYCLSQTQYPVIAVAASQKNLEISCAATLLFPSHSTAPSVLYTTSTLSELSPPFLSKESDSAVHYTAEGLLLAILEEYADSPITEHLNWRTTPFTDFGLDSLAALEVRGKLQKKFTKLEEELSASLLFDYDTFDELLHYLLSKSTSDRDSDLICSRIHPSSSTSTSSNSASSSFSSKIISSSFLIDDKRNAKELTFSFQGLTIAAKEWGNPTGKIKIFALHGWLDNASSFDNFASKLLQNKSGQANDMLDAAEIHLICIDHLGHGLSDHLPLQSTTPYTSELFVNAATHILSTQLKWPACHLIGHSMGSCIASLVAGLLSSSPNSSTSFSSSSFSSSSSSSSSLSASSSLNSSTQILSLLLLDCPGFFAASDLQSSLTKYRHMSFTSVQKAVDLKLKRDQTALRSSMLTLLSSRGLVKTTPVSSSSSSSIPSSLSSFSQSVDSSDAIRYMPTFDERLVSPSIENYGSFNIKKVLGEITCPTLWLYASRKYYLFRRSEKDVQEWKSWIEGSESAIAPNSGHHFHLDDPGRVIQYWQQLIKEAEGKK